MSPPAEDPHRSAERSQMVEFQLRRRGITSEPVLEAMSRIPRELFVPTGQSAGAYADSALPIDCGQSISQPYMVARMTELLELQPRQVVLEVGTGSGYQAAILACLAAHVYTIEWSLKLLNQATARLEALGLRNVSYRCGDGSLGWPQHAPFDAIMVTAGAPELPEPLCAQLADGGRLVAPTGPIGDQTLVLARRTASGIRQESILKCRFVKLLGDAGWPD